MLQTWGPLVKMFIYTCMFTHTQWCIYIYIHKGIRVYVCIQIHKSVTELTSHFYQKRILLTSYSEFRFPTWFRKALSITYLKEKVVSPETVKLH